MVLKVYQIMLTSTQKYKVSTYNPACLL